MNLALGPMKAFRIFTKNYKKKNGKENLQRINIDSYEYDSKKVAISV